MDRSSVGCVRPVRKRQLAMTAAIRNAGRPLGLRPSSSLTLISDEVQQSVASAFIQGVRKGGQDLCVAFHTSPELASLHMVCSSQLLRY